MVQTKKAPKRSSTSADGAVGSVAIGPLLAAALAKGLKTKEEIPAGMHQLRGQAVIDVDCFIEKGGPQSQKIPWPAKTILAVALGELVPNEAKLMKMLSRATEKVLCAAEPGETELGTVYAVLDRLQEANACKIPMRPVQGNTTVTGRVEVIGFDPPLA